MHAKVHKSAYLHSVCCVIVPRNVIWRTYNITLVAVCYKH